MLALAMNHQLKNILVMGTVALLTGAGCAYDWDNRVLPPEETLGWKAVEADRVYDADGLYEYMNGAAEVYRALDVQGVLTRRYAREGQPEILCDLYDMGSDAGAYGAYHHNSRKGRDAGIGRESELVEGALAFWKGPYYAHLMTFERTEESEVAMLNLARAMAQSIAEEGEIPGIVQALPERGLVGEEIHYFHTALSLNAHCFVADENILHLDAETEAVLAHYQAEIPPDAGPEMGGYILLLIRYPEEAAAANALQSFLGAYLPDADSKGMAQNENDQWTGAIQRKGFVCIVFDAFSHALAGRVLGEAMRNLEGFSAWEAAVED